mgnify:FL=1
MFNLSLEKSKNVVTNLANLDAPETWRFVGEFAIEKTSDSVANAMARMYKKLKDEGKGSEKKMPFIAMENFFVNTPMARADELRKAVKISREKLAEKLVNECRLSKKDAEKEAEKLIGATWDVGHINNLRRVAKELGETMSTEELKEMLERAASN